MSMYPENDWRDYLEHSSRSHKYISKKMGRSGKWIYTYPKDVKANSSRGGWSKWKVLSDTENRLEAQKPGISGQLKNVIDDNYMTVRNAKGRKMAAFKNRTKSTAPDGSVGVVVNGELKTVGKKKKSSRSKLLEKKRQRALSTHLGGGAR